MSSLHRLKSFQPPTASNVVISREGSRRRLLEILADAPAENRKLIDFFQPELDLLHNQIDALQELNNRLQARVDADFEPFLSTVQSDIVSYASASRAVNTYTAEWFSNQLYSRELLGRLAQVFINRVKPYISNVPEFWQDFATGDFTILDDTQSEEAQEILTDKGNPMRMSDVFQR